LIWGADGQALRARDRGRAPQLPTQGEQIEHEQALDGIPTPIQARPLELIDAYRLDT
jgi:hypothetical protein